MRGSRSRLTWRQAAPNRSCHAGAWPAGRLVPRPGRVDLGGHHDHRPAQVPAERVAVLHDVLVRAGPAQEEVAQEVALVLVLDRRHGLLAGDQQRRDGRGPLQRVHVVGGDRAVGAQADQPGQVGAAGRDPQAAGLAGADRDAAGAEPLDPQPPGRVEQAVLVRARRGGRRSARPPARGRRSR